MGKGRETGLYRDTQVDPSLTEVYYTLQSPKDINGKLACGAKRCPTRSVPQWAMRDYFMGCQACL